MSSSNNPYQIPQPMATASSKQSAGAKKSKSRPKKVVGMAPSSVQVPVSKDAINNQKQKIASIDEEKDDYLWSSSKAVVAPPRSNPAVKNQKSEENIVHSALQRVGYQNIAQNVQPGAIKALVDHVRSYQLHLMADAVDYALHRQNGELPPTGQLPDINVDDLSLAFDDSPSYREVKEMRNFYEKDINREPLPHIPVNYNGVVLPPLQHTLLMRTYDIIPTIPLNRMINTSTGDVPSSTKRARRPSTGGSKKKKIEINIKSTNNLSTKS